MIELKKIAGVWQHVDVSNEKPKKEPSEHVLNLAKKIHESRMGCGEPCDQCIDMAERQLGGI